MQGCREMPNPTSTLEELTASLPITRTLHHGFVQLLMLHQLWMSGCISKHFKASLTRTHRCPGDNSTVLLEAQFPRLPVLL